jgi:hypothetical protein
MRFLQSVFYLSTSSCGAEWLQRDCRVTPRAQRELPLRIIGRALTVRIRSNVTKPGKDCREFVDCVPFSCQVGWM